MADTCSAVASSPTAASPMARRRMVEWPARNPALTPIRPSSRSSHSPKLAHSPVEPGLQGGQRHALHPGQHGGEVLGVVGSGRRQREAAVPADHRRHPVQRRRAGRRIPEELGVVVGVQIDEPRGHQEPVGFDDPVGLLVDGADGHDPSVAHPDVGPSAPGRRCRRPPCRPGSTGRACRGPLLSRSHGRRHPRPPADRPATAPSDWSGAGSADAPDTNVTDDVRCPAGHGSRPSAPRS